MHVPQIIEIFRSVEIMADFVESILQRFRAWLGMYPEIDVQSVRFGKVIFNIFVLFGIICECPGRKCYLPIPEHILQQVVAEGRARYISQYTYAYEVVVHQQTESSQLVFLAVNPASILLAEEVDNCFQYTARHAPVVNRWIEEAGILRRCSWLIAGKPTVFIKQTLGILF